MKTYHKLTISFRPKDREIWDYIQCLDDTSISEYIRNLISQDMNNEIISINETKLLEKIKLLMNEFNMNENLSSVSVENTLDTDESQNIVNDLF